VEALPEGALVKALQGRRSARLASTIVLREDGELEASVRIERLHERGIAPFVAAFEESSKPG
jgi:hypothetical protein